MVWIRTIDPAEATGLLREAYEWQAERLGEPTAFTRLGSLYPELVMERLRLYRVVDACPSNLDPIERRLAAYVTSLLNGTTHCASGLRLALAELGADPAVVATVEATPEQVHTGNGRLDAICAYAAVLTSRPAAVTVDDVARLRAHGLDDLDLLDLDNIVAYYNYLNRVCNGLGLFEEIPPDHALRAVPR